MALQAHGIETYAYSREAENDPRAVLVYSFGADYISAGGVPAIEDPVPVGISRGMRDLVLKNQVFFGTVNAGLSAY